MKKLIVLLLFFAGCSSGVDEQEIVDKAVKEAVKAQSVLWINYLNHVRQDTVFADGDTITKTPNLTEFYKMSYNTAMQDSIVFFK